MKPIQYTTFAWVLAALCLSPKISPAAEVYLMRGGFDVFSIGMNEMAETLKKEGIDAKAQSFASWKFVADDIIKRSKTKSVSYPIVYLGHSFGADAGPDFANYLGKNGIQVDLVIGFDALSSKTLGPGAKKVINYCTHTGGRYTAGQGFRGKITEVDVTKFGVNHFNIEQADRVQQLALDAVRSQVRKGR